MRKAHIERDPPILKQRCRRMVGQILLDAPGQQPG
jgi:hypothetical protein